MRQFLQVETQALHFAELKLAISPNVGDSGAQFLVEGDCVRASPTLILTKIKYCLQYIKHQSQADTVEPGLLTTLYDGDFFCPSSQYLTTQHQRLFLELTT